jgi:hypothetical protein
MREQNVELTEAADDEPARAAAMERAEALALSTGVECAVYRDAQGRYQAGTQAQLNALPSDAAWWVASVSPVAGRDGVRRARWEGGMTF